MYSTWLHVSYFNVIQYVYTEGRQYRLAHEYDNEALSVLHILRKAKDLHSKTANKLLAL